MGYLIPATLSSLSVALLIKDNEVRGADTLVILAGNYLSASALAWGMQTRGVALGGGSMGRLSPTTWSLRLGGSLLFPGAFFLMMWGIRRYGISLAGSVSRLSLSVPLLFATLFLGERFTLFTAGGILGTFAALLLLSPLGTMPAMSTRLDRQALWYFPTLVLIFGVVDLWVNLFNTLAPAAERFAFIGLIFTGAAIVMGALIGRRGLRSSMSSTRRRA